MERTDSLAWVLYQERVREIENEVRRRRLLNREDEAPPIARDAARGRAGARLPAPGRGGSAPEPA